MEILDEKKAAQIGGEFYQVSVRVHGIKKRCRKAAGESIKVGYVKLEKPSDDELAELKGHARKAIENIMKKTGPEARITLEYCAFKETGIFTWHPFDERNLSETLYL